MTEQTLLAKLRQHQPHKVRCIDAHDEARTIAVPNRRRKWSSVVQTIEAQPWIRCELLDKAGDVLSYVENDQAAGELESLGDGGGGQSKGLDLRLMLEAQRVALSYRDKEHTTLLAAITNMLNEHSKATSQLVQLYQAQIQLSAEVAYNKAASEHGGEVENILKVLEASPELLAKFAPFIQMLMSKVPKSIGGGTQSNGVKKGQAS